jgi:DNA-binding CsgD family transcriptional regulator
MPAPAEGGLLVGRAHELARLTRCAAVAATGHGAATLIEGEPGIGKSALARAACAEAVNLGFQVFWGAGDELGQTLPLLPFLDALRVREPSANPRRKTILALLRGELAFGRGEDMAAALGEQLLAFTEELCAAQPVVLVVDDLQWADRASVTVWERLARSAGHLPLLLIGTMRPVPQREDLLALRHTADLAERLPLGGLTRDAVTDLVTLLARGTPSPDLMHLADGAAGNPLYLTELVDALARSSSLLSAGGSAEVAGGSAPGSLSAAIADRLGFVPPWVREVLRAAALLGVDFEVPDLATVLGRRVGELVPALAEARAAGVLTESGAKLGFRHPLIRAALYDEVPAPVRAAWHGEAARALATAGASPDRVARQLLPALDGASGSMAGWIPDWLSGTAPLLVGQAPRAAAELLREAVMRSPGGSAGHVSLRCRLAEALCRVGDITEAEQVANATLGIIDDPDLLIDLHWTLAECRTLTGKFSESLAALKEALALPGISGRHRARLLVLLARAHRNLGQIELAERAAATALTEAGTAADNWAMAWALHVLTYTAAMQGRIVDALPLTDRALAVTAGDPALTDLRLLLLVNKGVALGLLDHYDEAFSAVREAKQLAERAGLMVRRAQAHCTLGELLFHTGRWDDAIAEVAALQEDIKDPGVACCDHGIAAVISFHRGDAGIAREHLAAAAPHAERIGNRVVGTLALARSLDSEQVGALPEALGVLTEFTDSAEELDEIEDLLADGVRLATRLGDASTARSLAERAMALADGSEIPHRQANALYCRGLVDADATRLLTAADRYRKACRPLLGAKALEAAAGLLVDHGQRDPGRDAFGRAVDLYTTLGAARDVARLQARFREYGIRRGPRAKHRQARHGWDSLTPTEVKVAALVEQGLTNPQIATALFLSRKTVATHVSHILGKLGVASRIDIAREAAGRRALAG